MATDPEDKHASPLHLAADVATHAVGAVGAVGRLGIHVLTTPLRLPGLKRRGADPIPHRQPGTAPGIESIPDIDVPPPADAVGFQIIDYAADRMETHTFADVMACLACPRPTWGTMRWINIDGLHPFVVNQVKQAFDLHTLAAEDTLHVPQRPKCEHYGNYLFIVGRMMRLHEGHLHTEQISFFFFGNLLVTFQEERGDVWQPIRDRLEVAGSKLRTHDGGFLLYALLDAVVDHCFPILEHYSERLERLESVVLERPTPQDLQRIHAIKRELAVLRRVIYPLREMIDNLYRDENEMLSPAVKTYLRDVYDHAVQVMDIVETHREMAGGLTDLYLSAVSNRMNEIMKVLTIMASFFIPTTFVAGVYGMNFEHMPELGWKYAYPVFWIVIAIMVGGLLWFFHKRGWIGRH